PFVEVIDGRIVRERIIERDIEVEDWTQVEVHDRPIIDYDPGIVIGPYVLCGWGPREVAAELERHRAEPAQAEQEVDKLLYPVFAVAAVGLSIVAVVLL